jgi:SAM-dependent methyltransferase
MSKVFDAYAAYYDLFYDSKDYQSEANYVTNLLNSFGRKPKSLLELGCGTGGHAQYFAALGFEVSGIDLSEVMLKRANERKATYSAEMKRRLNFSLGDIRNARLGRQFDAAISLFHVISYQTQNQDLEAALETVAHHLPAGGIFVFDYWFAPGVLAQKPEYRVRTMQNETVSIERKATPVMNLSRRTVEVNFSVTLNSKIDDSVEQIEERHLMRYYDLKEIENAAKKYFSLKAHYGWGSLDAPTEKDWAAVTVLERQS